MLEAPSACELASEAARLAKLRSYAVLDTKFEAAFDDVVNAAAHLLNVPISLVSLIDEERQWFKARVGLDVPYTARSISFCTHAIASDEIYLVHDASRHPKFRDNPLVTGFPNIRFYAGAPLITPENLRVGTLCVIDTSPRAGLSRDQETALKMLSRLVVRELEHRSSREHYHLMSRLTDGLVGLTAATTLKNIPSASTRVIQRLLQTDHVQVSIAGCEPCSPSANTCVTGKITADAPAHQHQVDLVSDSEVPLGLVQVGRDAIFTEMEKAVLADFARVLSGKIAAARALERTQEQAVALTAQLAQSQKSEALGRLTGGFAHDFNNMLGAMIGNLDLLRDMHISHAPSTHLLDQIDKAGEAAAELIRRLLAFARQQPLRPLATDLSALVRGLRTMLSRTMASVNIEVDIRSPAVAVVDPAQLESAILNLVVNAKDAMPNGGTITIAVGDGDQDPAPPSGINCAEYVTLSVRDTGLGMTPEVLTRACEPFFTTKGVGHGSGLGLSMVYGFAAQSNGTLDIKSAVGVGTTVRLFFPRAAYTEPAPQDGPKSEAITGKGKILLVEDERLVREMTAAQLKSLGYIVTEVEDGRSAVAAIMKGDAFDLIITDVMMKGGMSGPQVAQEIGKLRPNLPVIYVSGYSRAPEDAWPEIPPHMLLAKPFKKAQLAAIVSSTLSTRSDSD